DVRREESTVPSRALGRRPRRPRRADRDADHRDDRPRDPRAAARHRSREPLRSLLHLSGCIPPRDGGCSSKVEHRTVAPDAAGSSPVIHPRSRRFVTTAEVVRELLIAMTEQDLVRIAKVALRELGAGDVMFSVSAESGIDRWEIAIAGAHPRLLRIRAGKG